MKTGRKLISLLLILAMVLSLAACSKKEETKKEENNTTVDNTEKKEDKTEITTPDQIVISAGDEDKVDETIPLIGNIPVNFPICSDGSVSLNVLIRSTASGYDDPTQVTVWQEYEKKTGIKVNWTDTGSDRKTRVQQALMGGEDYDLILKCKISQETLVEYGEQGVIVDLAEYLPTYAPNCWAYLQNHPDTLACIMSPEGNIWALPQVNAGAELRVSRKIFINKTWLDNLNLEVPTTTEEIYQVLKAFKEQDANGNGDPTDEIPLSTGDWASLQDIFLGAFGLGTRGQHNQVVDWDTATDSIRLIGTSDNYRKMLEYLNKLYSEGLIDQEQFSMGSTWKIKQADNRIGMYGNTNLAGITSDNGCEWIGIEEAIEGPDGYKLWAPIRANFHSVGNAIVPATCDNIPAVLQWLDYFWTDEGSLFYHYGNLGETCVDNGDGTYSYSDAVLAPMNSGASFDDCVGAVSPYPGGANPTVEVYPYFGGGETAPIPAKTALALYEYRTDEFWPEFTFTTDESAELSSIKTDITKTINTATTEFIMGTKSFADWDSFVSSIEAMNLERMLAIYSAAVDRYHAMLK